MDVGPWRRQWQPTPVLLPGKSHGLRILVGHGVAKSQTWLSNFTHFTMDVANLISGSSAFSKSNLHIWKFSVHILMKPRLPCYYNIGLIVVPGLPRWLSGKEPTSQYRRHRFDCWVRKISWRRKWQPTPVFLHRKSHGLRSLEGDSTWVCKESDTTEQLNSYSRS